METNPQDQGPKKDPAHLADLLREFLDNQELEAPLENPANAHFLSLLARRDAGEAIDSATLDEARQAAAAERNKQDTDT